MDREVKEYTLDVDFNGTWIADSIGMITLAQKELRVTGIYAGRESGVIEGMVWGNHLDFTWYKEPAVEKCQGRGVLEIIPNTGALVGLWGYDQDETKNEAITAQSLESLSSHPFTHELPAQDKMALKYAGYNLVLHRQYEQALVPLEKALELYRAELLNEESITTDSYLIDEVRILAHLLECYFELANDDTLHGASTRLQRQEEFYTKLLEYLLSSVDSYREFLQRTFQRHTLNPIIELTKASDALRHWQEQLVTQAKVLQQKDSGESDVRIPRMVALAEQLHTSYESLAFATDIITKQGKQPFGQPDMLMQALTSLTDYYDELQQIIRTDVEQILVIGKDWPEEQREFLQWITLLLIPIPLQLEGENKLIAQTQSNVEERVNYIWESAFRLSSWLEKWRVGLPTDQERIEALHEGQSFFQRLIQFYVDVGDDDEALVLSERARARAFADILAARMKTQSATSSLSSEIIGSVPGSHSDVPATLEDILQIVQQRNSVTIEYFLTQNNLIIWIITPLGKIQTVTVPIGKDRLDELVNSFFQLVQSPEYSSKKTTQLSNVLQELYQYLIEPIPAMLLSSSIDEILTIIPYGSLFQIPFGALKSRAGTYCIENFAFVYSPSIGILRYTSENKDRVVRSSNPTLLAFVNPELPPESSLGTLEFTEQNFDHIAAFYKDTEHNKIYKGKSAVKQVLEQEASHHTVLYFNTHGAALDDDPLNSYLVLANQSGDLKVPDISRLELHSDLVILSACETGRGRITGDGINGLSRAFTGAGTPSLLVSLWSIPEIESLELLYQFHKFWRETDASKAQALRQAQVVVLKNYPEQPDIWAAFVLMGEAI
jgi:CHAT domain-containing protein